MKTKHTLILLAILCMGIPANAQFFKKLKKKAENAAERTVLNKTDREVSKTTDKTIDGVIKGKPETEKEESESKETNEPTDEEKKAKEEKVLSFFGGGLEDIPDTYTFSYALTYEISSQKETMPLQYLLEPDATYFANTMNDPKVNQIMVYDFKKSALVTFMDNGEQKMAMKMKMPNLKKAEKKFGKKIIPEDEEDVEIVPIEGKTILGFNCNGFRVTSKDGIGKFWVTNDAPVSLNGVYANFSSLPKSAKDKALPLNEKSLVMEMIYTANRGKKNNMHMICTELNENPLEIHKKDYKSGM